MAGARHSDFTVLSKVSAIRTNMILVHILFAKKWKNNLNLKNEVMFDWRKKGEDKCLFFGSAEKWGSTRLLVVI